MSSEFIPTPPRQKDCRTPIQFDALVVFHKYRRRVCKRPSRPTLSELALELGGGEISSAVARSVVLALIQRGDVEREGKPGSTRCYRLTEQGKLRAKQRAKLVAEREAKWEKADKLRAKERRKPGYRSKPRRLPPTQNGVAP